MYSSIKRLYWTHSGYEEKEAADSIGRLDGGKDNFQKMLIYRLKSQTIFLTPLRDSHHIPKQ